MHLRSRAFCVALLSSFGLLACATHEETARSDDAGSNSANTATHDASPAPANGTQSQPSVETSAPNEDSDSDAPDVAEVETRDDVADDGVSDGPSDEAQSEVTDDSLEDTNDGVSGQPTDASGMLDGGTLDGSDEGERLHIPARIEAEDFVRFNEQDIENDSGDCGPGPVDLGTTDDEDGECYVGWTQGGEWLEYDVWADASADYALSLRLASDATSELQVLVDDELLFTGQAPGTGWDSFESVSAGSAALSEGAHRLRVLFVAGQVNFNYLVFTIDGQPVTDPPATEADAGGATTQPPDIPTDPQGCSIAPDGYALVWSDTFDYEGLPDPERWGYESGGDGFGNNELQFYTEGRSENANVAAGVLTVTAVHEEYMGNSYTSAKLNSGLGTDAGTWNEGIFTIRAKLPAGLGTWPALWMMPTNCAEGWPNCGEIDIMESVGYDEGVVHGTIHTDAFNHVEGTQIGMSTEVPDATSAFHTYTLVWTSARIEWQVDGNVYHSVDRQEDWGFAQWPFDDKLWHLMINLAVGGDWGGAEGVNEADYPATFSIDSVCVYQ